MKKKYIYFRQPLKYDIVNYVGEMIAHPLLQPKNYYLRAEQCFCLLLICNILIVFICSCPKMIGSCASWEYQAVTWGG